MLFILLISAAFATSDADLPQCSLKPPHNGEREVYLLTASPGLQPFSFLGHSALWVRDPFRKIDHILEFGAINSAKQEPLSSLLLGSLECTWWTRHIKKRVAYFERRDRASIAHPIVLPSDAEEALWRQLNHTMKNQEEAFLFDAMKRSCATEIRDMLDESLDGALQQSLQTPAQIRPKEDVLRFLAAQPWAWFALNTLNPQVRQDNNLWHGAFLPERLLEAILPFQTMQDNGRVEPILQSPCRLTSTSLPTPRAHPPSWAPGAWLVGITLGLAALGAGRSNRPFARWVSGLGLSTFGLLFGLLGTAQVLLATLSDLTYLRMNGNLFVSHPLLLCLIPVGVAIARRRCRNWMRHLTKAALILATVGAGLAATPWAARGDWATLGLTWPILLVAVLLTGDPRMGPTQTTE